MIVGIPKEIKNNESRVSMLPFGVEDLVIPSLMAMDDLEEIDSNSQFFQLNFVQTATDKQLYYLVGTLFFLLSFFLFISRRKFY